MSKTNYQLFEGYDDELPKVYESCPACQIPYDMADFNNQECSHCLFNAKYQTFVIPLQNVGIPTRAAY